MNDVLVPWQRIVYEPHHEKTGFCTCENKGADQGCSNFTADQCLYFGYMDRSISYLVKSEISDFWPSFVAAQAGLYHEWLETLKTGFSRIAARIVKPLQLIYILALHFLNYYNLFITLYHRRIKLGCRGGEGGCAENDCTTYIQTWQCNIESP